MEDLAEVVARRDLGDLAFERGSFNTAIKYYMRAITRHPRGPWAFWHIASAKFQQGDFEETIRFCTLAGDQVPQVTIVDIMLFSVVGFYRHIIISKVTSFQAIELRAQAHIKLGNTDKAMEDLQSFIHVGTVKRAKRSTPEKVSGSSNTIGNLVDAKAEADSNQNYKKIKGHNMNHSNLGRPDLQKTINDTKKMDKMSSAKISPLKRPRPSSNLNIKQMNKKLKSTFPQKYHDKDSMKTTQLSTHGGTKTEKQIASSKMKKVENSMKLGHGISPKLQKMNQNYMRKKHITKLLSKLPSEAKCKKGASNLRGILREEGQIMKPKVVRWKVPLEKVIWMSRNRKFQQSWEASFAEKISLSKPQDKR